MNLSHHADWIIFIGYLFVIVSIGVFFSRRQKSQEDYFVGGRNMNWIAVGISLFATSFSSISFLAYPREGAYEDYHLFLTLLFIPFFIVPLLWLIFVPLYIRLKVISIYEYLEFRFNRFLRRLGTILFAGYAIGWMGSMLFGMGLILQAVLGLTGPQMTAVLIGIGVCAIFYTSLGGVQAVIWNDVLQTIVLGGGMLVVFLLALSLIDGGFNTVVSTGLEHGKFNMFNTEFDITERRNIYSAIAFALFMYLPGYTVSQTTAQRYVCMNSLAEARKSLIISGIVSTVVCFLFFMVGSTLFAYYNQPGMGGFPELPRQDQLLPYFVATHLNMAGLIGILTAGLFAAALSTIDSGINSITAVFVYDWLSGQNVRVSTSRMITVFFGVLVIIAALIAPFLGAYLIEIIAKITGVFLGLLLGVFLLGMFVPRANAGGVMVGLACGVVALVYCWFGTPLPHWWFGGVTVAVTFFVGWLGSYLFPAPNDSQLAFLFYRKS